MKKPNTHTNLTRVIELTFGLIFLLILLASCEKEEAFLVEESYEEAISSIQIEEKEELESCEPEVAQSESYISTDTEKIKNDAPGLKATGNEIAYTGLEFASTTKKATSTRVYAEANFILSVDRQNVEGQNTGFNKAKMPTPKSTATINSWGSVVE